MIYGFSRIIVYKRSLSQAKEAADFIKSEKTKEYEAEDQEGK